MIHWAKVTKEQFDDLAGNLELHVTRCRCRKECKGNAVVETRQFGDGADVLRQVTSNQGTAYFVNDSLVQCTECHAIMLDENEDEYEPCKACGGATDQWKGYPYVD